MTAIVKSVAKMLARAGPILRRLQATNPIMVEVGVSTGLLGEHLLREHPSLIWHGIDPWLGSDDQPDAYVATGDIHAALSRAQAEDNMRTALARVWPFGGRATVLREASPEAARWFADASVDLVFLDADHSRAGVAADCAAWWLKVRAGGWLGGHDFANPDPRFRFGVDEAVEAFAAGIGVPFEVDGGGTWWILKPLEGARNHEAHRHRASTSVRADPRSACEGARRVQQRGARPDD